MKVIRASRARSGAHDHRRYRKRRLLRATGAVRARLGLAGAVALASVALLLVAASLRGTGSDGGGVTARPAPPPPAGALWAYRPSSLSDMAARSESIVVAAVTRVERGPDLRPARTTDDTGDGAVPTQRIHLRLEQELAQRDGGSPAGLVIFRTGGTSQAGYPLSLHGDPPYQPGERYALFVRARRAADGTVLPVAPDGRLRVRSDGTLEPMIDGPVANQLEGTRLADLRAKIR